MWRKLRVLLDYDITIYIFIPNTMTVQADIPISYNFDTIFNHISIYDFVYFLLTMSEIKMSKTLYFCTNLVEALCYT